MSGGAGRPWWRRNWWGLAAVVPLLAGVLLASPDDSFQVLRDEHTEEAVVSPGADGWVSFGGVRLRLAGFGPAGLRDGDGQPFEVPGLVAWQATLMVETGADPDALLGCRLELADAAGRRYLDAPPRLGSAHDASGSLLYSADCARSYDEEDQEGPFETVAYFLLPESTEPVALRVSHYTRQRAYVRFSVG